MRELLRDGGSVVMFLGHLGNWDHAGAWSTLELATVTTVAERLEPEAVFRRSSASARTSGCGSCRCPAARCSGPCWPRRREPGAFMPLLADRDLSNNGVEVDFFGEPARMAAGPAALAVATGAALFPVSIHYEELGRRRHGIVITWHDRVPVPESGRRGAQVAAMTQSCADALAGAIARAPARTGTCCSGCSPPTSGPVRRERPG